MPARMEDPATELRASLCEGGHVRQATMSDVSAIRYIERQAAQAFRDLGMESVASMEPTQAQVVTAHIRDGLAWVWDGRQRGPMAVLLLRVASELAHIDLVCVHPRHRGHQHGKTLLEAAGVWARAHHREELTLTTFREVPWNAPYYERLGFRILEPEWQAPEIAVIRDDERRAGLDRWSRVAMSRPVQRRVGAPPVRNRAPAPLSRTLGALDVLGPDPSAGEEVDTS